MLQYTKPANFASVAILWANWDIGGHFLSQHFRPDHPAHFQWPVDLGEIHKHLADAPRFDSGNPVGL